MPATVSTKKDEGKQGGFSAEERAALRQRAEEHKMEAKRARGSDKASADDADVLAKIGEMPAEDREMAERLSAIVREVAPELSPKLYYDQPGWARGRKVVCFFRNGQMDKLRYSTLGFSVHAKLDDPDGLWATSYALTKPSETAWEAGKKLVIVAVSGQAAP